MIDLHLHLDGSLSPELVKDLAREQGLDFPGGREALSAPEDCKSLNEYLACFDWPVKVLQSGEALERAAAGLVTRLAVQGLFYAEIRFAPQLHTQRGLTQQMAVEAVKRGIASAEKESGTFRAQIILCCMRGAEDEKNLETLKTAAHFLGDGVCALDLAGAEALYPTLLYGDLFRRAASEGIPFTIHAGEADGPKSVRQALAFGARRIGHGVRSVEDPKLLELLAEKEIPLELCFTSNLQTKAVRNEKEFPLCRLLGMGIPVTLNTDNMTVSNVTLPEEYKKLERLGLTKAEKAALVRNAAKAAFLPKEEKEKLLSETVERAWP